MTDDDLAALQPWLERERAVSERLAAAPARLLAATLDLADGPCDEGDALPPLWHLVYGHDAVPSAALGEDGAPRRDGHDPDALMPPIPLPQVMWAGADFRFLRPLTLGEVAERRSRIASMQLKHGRRGPMLFVTTEHTWRQRGEVALVERHQGVYLGPDDGGSRDGKAGDGKAGDGNAGAATAPAAGSGEEPAPRQRDWPMDEARLFRFSALTFNTHRIHYDTPYTTQVAGYPRLVVHGPLQALLLAESWRAWHPAERLAEVHMQAQRPVFLPGPVHIQAIVEAPGRERIWTTGAGGQAAITAWMVAAELSC